MREQQAVESRGAAGRPRRMTRAERALWGQLRDAGFAATAFRREVQIEPYRVAFASAAHRLAIEVQRGRTGAAFPNPPRAMAIECRGWRVLQFRRREVLEAGRAVLAAIRRAVSAQD